MLKIEGLKVRGLKPLDFTLQKGDVLIVRGASGTGKSLLLRALADLDETMGRVSLEGRGRDETPPGKWRSLVRLVAAESGWWRELALDHFTRLQTARRLMPELRLDPSLLDAPVARLSTGERQRLAFLRALEGGPKVLLLDEPTSALDETTTQLLEAQITRLQKEGVILVIVSHAREQAQRLATHILTLENGEGRFERA